MVENRGAQATTAIRRYVRYIVDPHAVELGRSEVDREMGKMSGCSLRLHILRLPTSPR